MNHLTLAQVEYIAFGLAKKFMDWDEPIPDFSLRFPGVLEACLATTRYTFNKKYLYRGLVEKAAILFYTMIKNHPFQNGNKRIAVVSLLCFLFQNKRWLTVDNHELYRFAKWVAESNSKLKDSTLHGIREFVSLYLSKIDK